MSNLTVEQIQIIIFNLVMLFILFIIFVIAFISKIDIDNRKSKLDSTLNEWKLQEMNKRN